MSGGGHDGIMMMMTWWYISSDSWLLHDVDSPEPNLLQVEGVLDNSRGGNPHPQYILLGGKIVGQSYPVYVCQVTEMINILTKCFNYTKYQIYLHTTFKILDTTSISRK